MMIFMFLKQRGNEKLSKTKNTKDTHTNMIRYALLYSKFGVFFVLRFSCRFEYSVRSWGRVTHDEI